MGCYVISVVSLPLVVMLCIIPYLDILFHCESILIGCMFVAIGAGLGT